MFRTVDAWIRRALVGRYFAVVTFVSICACARVRRKCVRLRVARAAICARFVLARTESDCAKATLKVVSANAPEGAAIFLLKYNNYNYIKT